MALQPPDSPLMMEDTKELETRQQFLEGLGFTEAQTNVFLAFEENEGPLVYIPKNGWIEGLFRTRSLKLLQLSNSDLPHARRVNDLRNTLTDCLAIAKWAESLVSLNEEQDLAIRLPWDDDPTVTLSKKAVDLFARSSKAGHKILNTKDIVSSMIEIFHFNSQPGVKNFYRAYAELYNYVRLWDQQLAALNLPKRTNQDIYLNLRSEVAQTEKHWSERYIGSLPGEIVATLLHWHFLETYSRFMPAMNSSGVGKSKAVDEISKCGPLVIGVVLRNATDTGYPPGDPEVYEFFRNIADVSNFREGEMIAYAFLEGAIQALQSWALKNHFITTSSTKTTRSDGTEFEEIIVTKSASYNYDVLVEDWRTAMKPIELGSSVLVNRKKRSEEEDEETDEMFDSTKSAEFISENCRSPQKKAFIGELVAHANRVWKDLREEREWTKNKLFMTHDILQERIKQFIGPFMTTIFPANEVQELKRFLVISIDEAGILFDDAFSLRTAMRTANTSMHDVGVLYYNIRRCLSGLQDYSVWCIPLSTRSKIENMVPAALKDPSMRVRKADRTRVPPFTVFPVDVALQHRLSQDMSKELRKSLADYSTLDHLSGFGRILWRRFIPKALPRDVNAFVLEKLLNEDPEDLAEQLKQPGRSLDAAACFAIFSSRIALDDFSNIVQARDLIRDSILSHLRLLKSFDQHSCSARSVTPSEPLVAQAVSGFLVQESLWALVIKAICDKILHPGLITKGARGEVYMQLLFILARDNVLNPQYSAIQNTTAESQRSKPASPPRRTDSTVMPAAGHFTLEGLLCELLTAEHFESIWEYERESSAGVKEKMGEVFKEAKLNYSHWATASAHLYGDKPAKQTAHGASIEEQRRLLSKNELLQLLLYRQSGLQMAVNQPEWDSALAMYLGESDKPVDPKKLSCIYIQTKNVAGGYSPKSKTPGKGKQIYQTSFTHFPIDPQQPKLGFIFNIGVSGEKAGVRLLPVEDESIWYFDVRGSGPDVFKCVGKSNELASACEELLGALHAEHELTDALQSMVSTYEPFSRITFAGQALGVDEVRED